MSDLAESLNNALDEEYDASLGVYLAAIDSDTPHTDSDVQFTVDDESSADWCLRKIATEKARLAEVDALANGEIARITSWRASEGQKSERAIAFFESLLHGFQARELAKNPKRKTIKLPHGTLSARTGQPRWDIDIATLLPWAQANKRKDLLRIKVEPNVPAIKRSLNAVPDSGVATLDGEVVPGITITPATTDFHVNTDIKEVQ